MDQRVDRSVVPRVDRLEGPMVGQREDRLEGPMVGQREDRLEDPMVGRREGRSVAPMVGRREVRKADQREDRSVAPMVGRSEDQRGLLEVQVVLNLFSRLVLVRLQARLQVLRMLGLEVESV